MHVALLSTCAVATPPRAYGGTELVVAELAKGLLSLGHEVTVYATGDSTALGRRRHHFLEPIWPPSELAEMSHAAFAWRELDDSGVDVVHVNHAAAVPMSLLTGRPTVLTLHHERVESLVSFYRDFPGVELVGISEHQRSCSPDVPIRHVVHHGLDPESYPDGSGEGDYVAFLGRFAPEKAPHLAIDAALEAGLELRLGGVPHEVSRDYFANVVKPRLDAARDRVRWLGEVSHRPKVALLRDARALVFPIQWDEPFGLVMIESMLVGTPVVALARGSAPEVVEEGVTGFVVRTQAELVDALRRARTIDRRRCRARALRRWSHVRMAEDYVRVYEAAIDRSRGAAFKSQRHARYNGAAVDAAG